MEIRREPATGMIRLHYSRQFQSSGQAHTIEAECLLPVGASQEMREQVVRELEASVGQLVHQITRQSTRPSEAVRSQATTFNRPAQTPTPPEAPRSGPSTTRVPVSDSMPTTPASSGERKIRLPDFINVIKKHWDMSPQEAMKLLNVQNLDGLNYREAYNTLKTLIERRNAGMQAPSTQYNSTRPIPAPPDAPRSPNRGTPPASDTHAPTNMMIMPRTQNQPSPRTTLVVPSEQESQPRTEPEPGVDFAGSSKAPIPIKFGTVREIAPPAHRFDEEEDHENDEEYDLPEESTANHLSGKLKLDELKELRGNTVASAGRLKVLDNVIGEQVNEEQLQKIMQAAWGITTAKKLKAEQIEGLINWAKEDSFEEEAQAVLAWIAEGEA
jgi:hypothetical protein